MGGFTTEMAAYFDYPWLDKVVGIQQQVGAFGRLQRLGEALHACFYQSAIGDIVDSAIEHWAVLPRDITGDLGIAQFDEFLAEFFKAGKRATGALSFSSRVPIVIDPNCPIFCYATPGM
jgi:hypothetical protein